MGTLCPTGYGHVVPLSEGSKVFYGLWILMHVLILTAPVCPAGYGHVAPLSEGRTMFCGMWLLMHVIIF